MLSFDRKNKAISRNASKMFKSFFALFSYSLFKFLLLTHSFFLAKPKRTREEIEEDLEGEWKTVPSGGAAASTDKPKMFSKDAEIDASVVIAKLNEVYYQS